MKKEEEEIPEEKIFGDITDRVKRMWFIDDKLSQIKKLVEYDGDREFVSFDTDTEEVIDKNNHRLKLYSKFKYAAIASLEQDYAFKVDRFKSYSKELLAMNNDISDLHDKINKLKNINPDE